MYSRLLSKDFIPLIPSSAIMGTEKANQKIHISPGIINKNRPVVRIKDVKISVQRYLGKVFKARENEPLFAKLPNKAAWVNTTKINKTKRLAKIIKEVS